MDFRFYHTVFQVLLFISYTVRPSMFNNEALPCKTVGGAIQISLIDSLIGMISVLKKTHF